MKSCPSCRRLFAADAGFCPHDGGSLLGVDEVPVPPDAADPRVGSTLCGRWHIRRIVADGGMGRVYEALDLAQPERVAIKVLHPDIARDDVAVERFRREFEVSKLVPHAHIVEVKDFCDTGDGSSALVMEFLDGEELRTLLKRERHVSPARLVRMLAQATQGLDEAHRQKLVHRDLKPDNLFLCGTHDGDVVKVLDFGSVKDKSQAAKKLTMLGTTIGSPFYMSPEQAQGLETLDARADVWSLAAIAYECLTGTVPFVGKNGPSILLAILTEDPVPPTEKGRGGPVPIAPAVDDVIESALAKNPALRPPTAGALADAFGHAYGLEGTHLDWAWVPEGELARRIEKAMAAMPPAQARFDASRMDAAFADAPTSSDERAMGLPSATPRWVLPAVVAAVVALVVAVVATVVARAH